MTPRSSICCGECGSVATTNNHIFYCTGVHCNPDPGSIEIAHNTVRAILWQIFNQSIVNESVTFDGCMFNDSRPVFDFEIPEYRLLIDVWTSNQYPPIYKSNSDLDKREEERLKFESYKNKYAADNNYRRQTILISSPDDDGEMVSIRNSILNSINEVYVKETPGKMQVLTPRLQGDVGWDLVCDETVVCPPNAGVDVPTQVYLEMPNHLFAVVQARSSTSKRKLIVLPGVIDPSYRGQIYTMVFNPTSTPAIIQKGDRISQLLFFHRIPHLHINPVSELRPSERGTNGFGSTNT